MNIASKPVTGLFALLSLCFALLMSGCALFQPSLEKPTVKVAGLRLLPSQGLQQRIAVDLAIANPNPQDLSLRGISYSIGIENFDLLSGVTSQVPTLNAYTETPVTLEVSANLLELVRLLEHISRNGLSEQVNYRFNAKLDFSRWLPAMNVQETGAIPLIR